MVRGENMPWCWLLLGILKDSGGIATLRDIYGFIEEGMAQNEKEDSNVVNPRLRRKNLTHGDRPIYQHTVRGCFSSYQKQGLVERIDRATYRITKAGLRRVEWYNKYY